MSNRRFLPRMLKVFTAAAAVLLLTLGANTLRLMPSSQAGTHQAASALALSRTDQELAALLGEAVAIRTISYRQPELRDSGEFERWNRYLGERFPLVHSSLDVERIGEYNTLYTWRGTDPELAPVLLTAHFDVVAVEEDTIDEWIHPPFSGQVADGYVWGRGTMDDKMAAVSILAALTELLESGFQSERTIMVALGQDEEVGGHEGAALIGKALGKRGVEPLFILDEGMPVTQGILKGIDAPVALIGVAEKGYVNLELTVNGSGGHSSTPPAHTAVGILGRAVARLEDNPMPARLDGATAAMFDSLAPHMPLARRVILANRWLFRPILLSQLSQAPATNAMIRTTAAPTVFEGSPQENVLAGKARAVINFRLLPGDTVEHVIQHVQDVIGDLHVSVRTLGDATEPSTVADPGADGFAVVERSIRDTFPKALTAPALLVAVTDTKHYRHLTPNIYRFRPIRMGSEDIRRFHGTNERVSISNLRESVQFYVNLLRLANGPA